MQNSSVRLKSSQSAKIAVTMPILAYIEQFWMLFLTLVAKSYIERNQAKA